MKKLILLITLVVLPVLADPIVLTIVGQTNWTFEITDVHQWAINRKVAAINADTNSPSTTAGQYFKALLQSKFDNMVQQEAAAEINEAQVVSKWILLSEDQKSRIRHIVQE